MNSSAAASEPQGNNPPHMGPATGPSPQHTGKSQTLPGSDCSDQDSPSQGNRFESNGPAHSLKNPVPQAVVQPQPGKSAYTGVFSSRIWIFTAVCVLCTLGLYWASWRAQGPTILVRFQNGHGLKPGDSLKYRGIEAGRVISVTLEPEWEGQDKPVQVAIQLDAGAANLAREGSRFWIERPRLSFARVSGLETALGAKYVGVQPAPDPTPRARLFEGLETPPTLQEGNKTQVRILFQQGHGLAVGDPLRYRGNILGEVVAIDWEARLNGLKVTVGLVPGAETMARVGSQFWIERPRLSALEVKGLDTLVGGRFLGVAPGPVDAPPLEDFQGLEQPPIGERPAGSLEILVEGPHRQGLETGVPVTYRGIPVGQVVSVGLAHDAVNVEARVWIQPGYTGLVRENTRFWSASGVDVSLGWLSGMQFRADTLATVAMGSLAFATPTQPGKPVLSGRRFSFSGKPEAEWLTWSPRLALGPAGSGANRIPPEPVRATLKWREKSLGFHWSKEKSGWVVVLDGNRLAGPRDLFEGPSTASAEKPIFLECLGRQIPIDTASLETKGSVAVLKLGEPIEEITSRPAWAPGDIRVPTTAESVWILADNPDSAPLIAAHRFQVESGSWKR